MGKGRKPTPSHLKLVKGTNRKDRENGQEPQPQRARPSMPAHMSDRAKEVWGYVVALLDRMGVLTEADAMALEQLCEAYADWRDARETIEAAGAYYETVNQAGGTMIRAHPAVSIRNDAARRVQSLMAEFGMTPSSRSKVKGRDGDEEQNDPLAKYGL